MKLSLGTAQLGLAQYGRTNATGCPSEAAAIDLIHAALEAGVRYIDCARAYGLAEERVGKAVVGNRWSEVGGCLRQARCGQESGESPQDVVVITKLSPLSWLAEDAAEDAIRSAVEASVYQSCRNLCVHQLPVLMVHRWAHHDLYDGKIWKILLDLKATGVIKSLGASLYTPDEAICALADLDIEHLQIPFNILDRRWLAEDFQHARAARPDVKVHVRSAFLQGILLGGPGVWPRPKEFDAERICETLDRLVCDLNRHSRADLCIAYLKGCEFVDSIVLGMETIAQLKENIDLFENPSLSGDESMQVETAVGVVPAALVNPAEW